MTELLGRPIKGEIVHYTEHAVVEQWDAGKFMEMLDALFEAGATKVGWRQYTPYFNDGDACIFSAEEVHVSFGPDQLSLDVEEADEDDYEDEDDIYFESDEWLDSYNPKLRGKGQYGYDASHKWRFIREEGSEVHPIMDVYDAFNSAITAGHFDNVINKHFGDPARVIATPEGFSVATFDHD